MTVDIAWSMISRINNRPCEWVPALTEWAGIEFLQHLNADEAVIA